MQEESPLYVSRMEGHGLSFASPSTKSCSSSHSSALFSTRHLTGPYFDTVGGMCRRTLATSTAPLSAAVAKLGFALLGVLAPLRRRVSCSDRHRMRWWLARRWPRRPRSPLAARPRRKVPRGPVKTKTEPMARQFCIFLFLSPLPCFRLLMPRPRCHLLLVWPGTRCTTLYPSREVYRSTRMQNRPEERV